MPLTTTAMATATTRCTAACLLLLTLLLAAAPPSHSLPTFLFTRYHNLLSLAHSLTTRVANLRASRNDYAGATRARLIAQKLESGLGLGFYKLVLSMGLDYVKNYAWRINSLFSSELHSAVGELNELLASLGELTRLDSNAARAAWVQENYRYVLRVSSSVLTRLLKVFGQSGPLREVVETLQKEVVEGDLLKDYLELGANDLKGLMQVLKDIALQYTSAFSGRTDL